MRLAVIGTGNMGQALLKGMLNGQLIAPDAVTVFDIDPEKTADVAAQTGCIPADSPFDAVHEATHVLVAVKPKYFDTAVDSFVEFLKEGATVISVAAGIRIKRIRNLLGTAYGIARVFPNTPALVGSGVMAVCFDQVDDKNQEAILSLMASCGMVVPCDEKTLDAIGAVSGTGPAWVMLFVEALADGAVQAGVPRPIALKIAAATVEGSGRLLTETGLHPAILKDQVCSPGGTTIEGVRALEKAAFRSAVIEAVAAAAEKSGRLVSDD